MDTLRRNLACLSLLLGSGTAWAAPSTAAGDGIEFIGSSALERIPADAATAAVTASADANLNPNANAIATATAAPLSDSTASALPPDWPDVKVSDARLDEMRGGFDIAPGLEVSFGIERVVFINGELVATSNFNIPNIAQINGQQAQMLATALGTTTLVQNGPGNSFQPSAGGAPSAATIVQNTLNNQDIKALTTINATVNTLGLYKALNLQSTLNQAIANSVGAR